MKVRASPPENDKGDAAEIEGIWMWKKWKLGKGMVRSVCILIGVWGMAMVLACLLAWLV